MWDLRYPTVRRDSLYVISSLNFMPILISIPTYIRSHFSKARPVEEDKGRNGDVETAAKHDGHVHVHTHANHGHVHGLVPASPEDASLAERIRHRIISQVLELGIVVHSLILGISLGFHQFFEGIGLGGCIVQVLISLGMRLVIWLLSGGHTLVCKQPFQGSRIRYGFSLLFFSGCLFFSGAVHGMGEIILERARDPGLESDSDMVSF